MLQNTFKSLIELREKNSKESLSYKTQLNLPLEGRVGCGGGGGDGRLKF